MREHIIFDLDGTLIDSANGIYDAFVKSCRKVELIPPRLEEFKRNIGPPIQVIARNTIKDATCREIEQIEREFRKIYDSTGFMDYRVYGGADRTIKEISRNKDISMSIVTNKPTFLAIKIIEKEKWGEYFSFVLGIDFPEVMYSKSRFTSKSEALAFAIKLCDIKNDRTYYIGDTVGDRDAAERNKIKFVAVKYGFHNWQEDEIKGRPSLTKVKDLLKLIRRRNNNLENLDKLIS